jgi:uncharacterized protein (DUF1015 family)
VHRSPAGAGAYNPGTPSSTPRDHVTLIQPFAALRPAPGRAAEVIAPPYDVVSTDEARHLAAGRPWSFLHVSRPEIDLAPGTDAHAPEVYAAGQRNLAALLEKGVLQRDTSPAYYAYRMRTGKHSQTGLVVAADIAAYDAGRIRRHELTRPDKEDDRVHHIEAVGGHTGPVLLAYPSASEVDDILARATAAAPSDSAIAPDGVEHALWRLDEPALMAGLTAAFDRMPVLYIADGHHRSAAASRVAAHHRAAGCGAGHASQRFLAVAFPHHAMRILAYNRVVTDLGRWTPETFLAALAERFEVTTESSAVTPRGAGGFGLLLRSGWYRLTLPKARIPVDDPVASLDVSLLAREVLEPLLGIVDARRDQRIDFVGGIRGLDELERRVAGGSAAAFAMHPTPLESLMAVADLGLIMPPKSTWFEPKLADGMACLMID